MFGSNLSFKNTFRPVFYIWLFCFCLFYILYLYHRSDCMTIIHLDQLEIRSHQKSAPSWKWDILEWIAFILHSLSFPWQGLFPLLYVFKLQNVNVFFFFFGLCQFFVDHSSIYLISVLYGILIGPSLSSLGCALRCSHMKSVLSSISASFSSCISILIEFS